ncbi:MAG: TMEM175 family protein [Melioribacteraceae bacterium]
MKTNRLEAFSDGVLAIIITIMVLELKVPEETDFSSLIPKIPVFLSYLVSFVYIGIYWNNHHHLFQISEKVNGQILWANLHLLFWLSLIPFTTSWIGENYQSSAPVTLYGIVLLMSGIAYFILQNVILNNHEKNAAIHKVIESGLKGKLSIAIYVLGIVLSLYYSGAAIVCYITVAIAWFIPDKQIEKNI